MTSNLLFIPIRATTTVDIVRGLKESIEKVYKRGTERYEADLLYLEQLRCDVERSKQTIDTSPGPFIIYYDQLSVIGPKFPYEVDVEFMWYNTLGYATKAAVVHKSIAFERINVLYNVAAVYSYLGFSADTKAGSGLKDAFKYYQISSGALRLLIDKVLPEFQDALPLGLELETLEALHYLMLAQAQESFWLKAVLDGLKNGTIAKLASQVSFMYEKALEFANRTPSLRSEWVYHITCKRYHFQAASQFRLALDCLDKGRHGEEVARLRRCINSCKEALAVSKYVVEPVISDVNGLYETAKNSLKISEKDNDYIYLQQVPETLPDFVHGELIAKPQILPELVNYEQHIRNMGQTPLLTDLIPYSVYEANDIYTQNTQDYVLKNIIQPAESISQKWRETLEECKLPGCLSAIEEPKGVPTDLITTSDDLRSQNAIYMVKRRMEDIMVLSKHCEVLLRQSKKLLSKEAEEDSMMRTRFGAENWTLPPSSESADSLNEKFKIMNEYIASSLASDELVRSKYKNVEHLLEVLQRGQEAMHDFIPNTLQVDLSNPMKRCMSSVRNILTKASKKEEERARYLSSLRFQVKNIDFRNDLIEFYKQHISGAANINGELKVETSQFEQYYQNMLQNYNKDLHWLQGQKEDGELLTASLKSEITNLNELSKIETSARERQTAIQCLEVAFFKYTEIKENLEEGILFYNSFLQQLNGFVTRCKEYVHERRIAAAELEERLLISSSNPAQNSNVESSGELKSKEPLPAPKARHLGHWD